MAIRPILFLIAVLVKLCTCEVVTITDDNWREILSGHWMVEFYAPWCGHCKSFASVWEEFGVWAENEDDLKVGAVDVTQQSIIAGQFMITQLPTLLHIKDGIVREFSGSDRSYGGLRKYIMNEKWSDADPIPWYKSPTSLHMRVVGYLFILAKQGQVIEEYLHKEYDLPTWAIFAIIACATLIAGLALGGVFLCLCEFMNRRSHSSHSTPSNKLPQETRELRPAKNKESKEFQKTTEGVRKRAVDEKKTAEN